MTCHLKKQADKTCNKQTHNGKVVCIDQLANTDDARTITREYCSECKTLQPYSSDGYLLQIQQKKGC